MTSTRSAKTIISVAIHATILHVLHWKIDFTLAGQLFQRYDAPLLVMTLAAMVPQTTVRVGSSRSWYLAHVD